MFNLVDRGLMILLLQPIKEDLRLSDTQLGLLTGIAFGLFYATMGVPLARWADRGNRVTVTALSIGLWGLTIMACLFVTNFAHLLVARVAAAVGESGCKPPTYSLVGDYFREGASRARAMSVYVAGSPLSTFVSFVVGGWLNSRYGWRVTFFILGIPGLLLALLVSTTVAEPRCSAVHRGLEPALAPPLKAVFALLWRQRSSRHLSFALILFYTMGLGLGPWYAAFMIRSHGMETRELGLWFGMIFSIAGAVGVLVGGYVVGRWYAHEERSQMRLSAIMVGLLVPCYVAFLTLPTQHLALGALVPLMTIFSIFLGPTYALMQRLVAANMRATTMAVVMLMANLIGFGLGPQIVGILSDALSARLGSESLRYAMLSMSFVSLWSAYHFWQAGNTVEGDLALAMVIADPG